MEPIPEKVSFGNEKDRILIFIVVMLLLLILVSFIYSSPKRELRALRAEVWQLTRAGTNLGEGPDQVTRTTG